MKALWHAPYTLQDLSFRTENLAALMGIELTEIGADFLKGRMPVDARTKQPFGLLHGGASCALSETLGSVAAWMCIDPEKQSAVGIEINANHLRGVREGLVTGLCRPLQTGRKIHVWQTEITDDATGKPVCVSRLTVAITEKTA